jgi:pyruvate carboxylase
MDPNTPLLDKKMVRSLSFFRLAGVKKPEFFLAQIIKQSKY